MGIIEDTPGTRAEQARMAALASDADVLAACDRYFAWLDREKLTNSLRSSALSQKILFVRNCLLSGERLRDALRFRLMANVDRLEGAVRGTGEDLSYAINYVVGCIRADMRDLDFDPKFLYMSGICEASENLWKSDATMNAAAHFNTLLVGVPGEKFLYAKMISDQPFLNRDGQPSAMSPYTVESGRRPFEQHLVDHSLAISSSVNNNGGRFAWDEGEVIAKGIDAYISDPRSAGQLCSLLPPEGPSRVDWSRNDWVRDPRFQRWLSWSDYEDLIAPFDMMRAEPSRILAE